MTARDTTIYDFTWDDQGDSGVWVNHDGTEVLVEASVHEPDEDAVEGETSDWFDRFTPVPFYLLASAITLAPGDGIVTPADPNTPLYGAAAASALARLQRIEEEGTQTPVNPEQVSLLAAFASEGAT